MERAESLSGCIYFDKDSTLSTIQLYVKSRKLNPQKPSHMLRYMLRMTVRNYKLRWWRISTNYDDDVFLQTTMMMYFYKLRWRCIPTNYVYFIFLQTTIMMYFCKLRLWHISTNYDDIFLQTMIMTYFYKLQQRCAADNNDALRSTTMRYERQRFAIDNNDNLPFQRWTPATMIINAVRRDVVHVLLQAAKRMQLMDWGRLLMSCATKTTLEKTIRRECLESGAHEMSIKMSTSISTNVYLSQFTSEPNVAAKGRLQQEMLADCSKECY